jgi:hypothetical protein
MTSARTSRPELFRISLDNTGLNQILDVYDSQLKRHDDQIQELFRLIATAASKDDLQTLKADVNKDIHTGIQNMNSQITEIKSDDRIPNLLSKSDSLAKKLTACDTQNQQNTSHLQTIASAFAALNKAQATLDASLPRTLLNATQHVTHTFTKIFEALRDLKTQVDNPPPPPEPPRIDLSGLHPHDAEEVPFQETHSLPDLTEFTDIRDSVAYIYEAAPRIQAILNAHHSKIEELDVRPPPEAVHSDENLMQELVNKIRTAMAAMSRELNELRTSVEGTKTLTRADVARMIRDMQAPEDNDETAIGCVHCIACGREIRQVVGALPAEEVDKALGVPPSSVVRTSSTAGQLGQMFGTGSPLEHIMDSPRAPRPIRRPRIVKQQQPQYRYST